jgi:transposase
MKKNGKAGSVARRERRAFSADFKREAVRLLADRRAVGVSLTQVARELDVGAGLLQIWARELRSGAETNGQRTGESPEQELRRLRREVATLRQEQAFAKKVAVYFARESR